MDFRKLQLIIMIERQQLIKYSYLLSVGYIWHKDVSMDHLVCTELTNQS